MKSMNPAYTGFIDDTVIINDMLLIHYYLLLITNKDCVVTDSCGLLIYG